MQIATLSHSSSGTSVSITETPLPVMAAGWIGDRVFGLTNWLARGWTFRIRWGPADEDGYCPRCLGSILYGIGQWSAGGFGLWRRERQIAEIPVSYEFVREHWPSAGWPWDGSGGLDKTPDIPLDKTSP